MRKVIEKSGRKVWELSGSHKVVYVMGFIWIVMLIVSITLSMIGMLLLMLETGA